MGFTSQSGQVGLAIQGSRGVAAPATCFARLRSGSLGADRSLMIPDPEVGGHRDVPGAYLSPLAFSGDFEFYPRMRMLAMLLRGALGDAASFASGGGVEVQEIATSGTPTGGSFRLRFRGTDTAAIDFDATASEVQAALEALPTIAPGDVTVTGGALGTAPVVVTFGGVYDDANVPQLQVRSAALTGGSAPSVAVTVDTEGAPPTGTHIITPTDVLPWLSVEEKVSTGFESFRYTDAKVNSLRLEAEATGYLMGSANIAALSQVAGFTPQVNPAWDNTPMIVGSGIGVRFNGAELLLKSMNLEINNNIETDDFVLGSISPADMTEKRREIRAGASYRPQDADLWRAAMYGGAGFTEPQAGPAYEGPLELTIQTIERIGNDPNGERFGLRVEIPHAAISPFKVTPSGDDVIQNDIEITALRPDAAEPIITCTVVNDLATVV